MCDECQAKLVDDFSNKVLTKKKNPKKIGRKNEKNAPPIQQQKIKYIFTKINNGNC